MRGRREVSRLSNGAFSSSSRLSQSSLQDCCVPSWTTCPAFGTFLPTLLLTFSLSHTFLSPQAPFRDLCFPFPLSSAFPAIPTECFCQLFSGDSGTVMWPSHFWLFLAEWLQMLLCGDESSVCPPCLTPSHGPGGQDPTVLLLLGVPQGFRPWPHCDGCKGWLWTQVAATVQCWQQSRIHIYIFSENPSKDPCEHLFLGAGVIGNFFFLCFHIFSVSNFSANQLKYYSFHGERKKPVTIPENPRLSWRVKNRASLLENQHLTVLPVPLRLDAVQAALGLLSPSMAGSSTAPESTLRPPWLQRLLLVPRRTALSIPQSLASCRQGQ